MGKFKRVINFLLLVYWSCSFNQDDPCQANLNVQPSGVQGSNFPWLLHTGRTPSDNTGPESGNGGGGKYCSRWMKHEISVTCVEGQEKPHPVDGIIY